MDLSNTSVIRLARTEAYAILDDQLYLSAGFAATKETDLQADGITHVLNVAKELDTQHFHAIHVLHLLMYDSPQQVLPLESAAAYMDESISNGGRCLVHCNAGQSRSASCVVYYLMKYHNLSLQTAFQYAKARKPNIGPNYGFLSQLEQAETDLRGSSSFDMNEYKATSILEILEGSGKTKEDVLNALQRFKGDGELALGMLLD